MLEKTLENPLDCKEFQPVYPKGYHWRDIWCSFQMLKLKLQYFGHLMRRADSFEKTLMLERLREEIGTTEDEMVGRHHRLNGHEFDDGVGDGQGGLVCCGLWGRKESDTTERLN